MTSRVWFARDCWLTADPRVQTLGDEYGAQAVLILEELLALAKLTEENGRVSTTYAVVARRAFSKAATVKKIIIAADELGLVDREGEIGPKAVVVSFPRWARWQIADPRAAARQAAKRARDKARNGHVDGTEEVTP